MVNITKNNLQQCAGEVGISPKQFKALWKRIRERTDNKIVKQRSAYNLFSQSIRKENKHISMREIAEKWKVLEDDQRDKFKELASNDKLRYNKEMSLFEKAVTESLTPEQVKMAALQKLSCKLLKAKCKEQGK